MTEREVLVASLQEQRRAVITKLTGLTEDEARLVLIPSGWSLLDMVIHLQKGEEFWVRAIAQGAQVSFDPDDPSGRWAWPRSSSITLDQAIHSYTDEALRTDDFLQRQVSLDVPPVRKPVWEITHHWAASLRAIVVHLIDETARHAGHVDIVRELIDGRVKTLREELETR